MTTVLSTLCCCATVIEFDQCPIDSASVEWQSCPSELFPSVSNLIRVFYNSNGTITSVLQYNITWVWPWLRSNVGIPIYTLAPSGPGDILGTFQTIVLQGSGTPVDTCIGTPPCGIGAASPNWLRCATLTTWELTMGFAFPQAPSFSFTWTKLITGCPSSLGWAWGGQTCPPPLFPGNCASTPGTITL